MSDEAYALAETPRFQPGRVIADSFETFGRIAPQVAGIVLIVAVPLFVWLVLGGKKMLMEFALVSSAETWQAGFDPAQVMLMLLIALIGLAIHGAVTDAAFQDLLGEPADLLQSLGRALVMAPSLVGAGLFVVMLFGFSLVMLGVAAGLLAGVLHWSFGLALGLGGGVGLAMLALRWWLLIPVIVVEGAGPIACIKRSTALTEGHRWKLLALLLTLYLPQLLVKLLLVVATPVLGAVVIAVVNIVISGVFTAFNAVAATTIYGHLRAIKEGSGLAGLAEIFE
ncbi:hypothetical protein [Dongia sp.]|uniref:hypothetical protein n=1 Tax=Dongia sp. TaxID=1977262 RepID=UPI003751285E